MDNRKKIMENVVDDIRRIAKQNIKLADEKGTPLLDGSTSKEFKRIMETSFANLVMGQDGKGDQTYMIPQSVFVNWDFSGSKEVRGSSETPSRIVSDRSNSETMNSFIGR